jgi:catalase-peroxidase
MVQVQYGTDAHNPSKSHAPFMLTSDLALRVDPIYEPISDTFMKTLMY